MGRQDASTATTRSRAFGLAIRGEISSRDSAWNLGIVDVEGGIGSGSTCERYAGIAAAVRRGKVARMVGGVYRRVSCTC